MKEIHIPHGFKNLVEMAETQRFKSKKPKPIDNDNEMWHNFCWAVLLGGTKTESEVNYVFEILHKAGLLERDNLLPDWQEDASYILSDAKDKISDEEDNPDGKISAIKKIEVELSKTNTTLKSADEIFDSITPRIDANYLKRIAICKDFTEKIDKENNLIAAIATPDKNWKLHSVTTHPYKIPWFAYTKTILWMHSCGIGLDYIPDNTHSKKFLKACNSKWSNPDFFIINHNFKKVCNKISTEIYYSGWALWIYESTKSLINSNKKKEFYKPDKIIKIMDENGWDINDVANMLADIECVEYLEETLNNL